MKLSTKGRYAITAMMEIALREHRGPITLADISITQGISNSYLEQLFSQLRKNGLVKGVRGPHGGYRLARPANEITVAQIITAVDKKGVNQHEGNHLSLQDDNRYKIHELWSDLSAEIYRFLDGITLAKYVEHPSVPAPSKQTESLQQDRFF